MLKVLIVDDDEGQRLILSRLLKRKMACEIFQAENGLEGLKSLEKNNPDVIFLDVSMPIMNGEETLEAIRSDPSTAKIPVIILTALNDKKSVGKLIEKGISDYLLKPLDFDYAYDRIYRVLTNIKKHKNTTIRQARILSESDGKIKVLMVERDSNFRNFFSTLFNERFDIIEASSGMEGLTKYMEKKPQYVILGERLNLLNEKLLSQKIRSLDAHNSTNIYLCTENPQTTSTDTFFFDGVIKKTYVPENMLKEFNKTVIGQEDIYESLIDIINKIMPTNLIAAVKQTFGVMTNQEILSITKDDLNFEGNILTISDKLANNDLRIYVDLTMYCAEKDMKEIAFLIRNTEVSLEEAKNSYIDLFNTILGRVKHSLDEKGIKMSIPGVPVVNIANNTIYIDFLIDLPFHTQSGQKFLIGISSYKE
ncbi:MAG TPA: response regulator [Melioribacteraceae bacterium]|nr:response regulator [Melioribacteraceae bacterium]